MGGPTGDILSLAPAARPGPLAVEPSVALAILDALVDGEPTPEAASAWDAAWIACLTGSPRWVETARREFMQATRGVEPSGR